MGVIVVLFSLEFSGGREAGWEISRGGFTARPSAFSWGRGERGGGQSERGGGQQPNLAPGGAGTPLPPPRPGPCGDGDVRGGECGEAPAALPGDTQRRGRTPALCFLRGLVKNTASGGLAPTPPERRKDAGLGPLWARGGSRPAAVGEPSAARPFRAAAELMGGVK